eukprot:jgi/Psemu1/6402/gm1.6402_g
MVCVDSVFRVYTGRLHCLIQSLQSDPDLAEAVLLNWEATALCQLSEWGMQMIQGQLPQLKDKLVLETFGDWKVTMNLVILLYNYQTSTIGHNQILNVFMHQMDGYFSYANEPTEDVTGMFEWSSIEPLRSCTKPLDVALQLKLELDLRFDWKVGLKV